MGIGVVLLWISSAWNTRDKLVGTLLPPGGLGLFFVALVVGAVTPGSATSCSGVSPIIQANGTVVSAPPFKLSCVTTGGLPWPVTVLLVAGLLVLLVLPFLTMGYLLRRLHSARRVPLGELAA